MRHIAILMSFYLLTGAAFSLVLHPDGEPDENWQDRPSDAVAARIGVCSGTVIGPQHILTAAHIPISLSTTITVDGDNYHPEKIFTHPVSDIRLIEIADADFDEFIHIPEAGLNLSNENIVTVINGWGKSRGSHIHSSADPNIVVGYAWSSNHGKLRWGTSKISGHSKSNIYTHFDHHQDPEGTAYECALASYDSGCGMFHFVDGQWVLAAIGLRVSDYGYGYFRDPTDLDKDYGTLNIFLQTQPFSGWIKSIMYGPDITEDGKVDTADLIQFQKEWLEQNTTYNYRSDLNRDGSVNGADFSLLAASWSEIASPGDITGNGHVDFEDLTILMGQWLDTPGQPSADIAPEKRDNLVNLLDFAELTRHWGD